MEFLMDASLDHRHDWSVGVDLHKDTMTVCIYCAGCGEFSFRKLACKSRNHVRQFFQNLPRPHTVAIEAVGFYRWLWELLEPIVEKLLLADATAARALAGRRLKTDREDAFNVAELLAAGRLPTAYAPPAEVQTLRDWTRRRNRLSRGHAQVLHWVKALMNSNNRPGPARLDSQGLIRYLKAQGPKLPERHVRLLWHCVDQLSMIERQIDEIERTFVPLLDSPTFRDARDILLSFPGVGWVTAATLLAEIGDFTRFGHRKAIARYVGLNPRVYASGPKNRTGHIAKAGPPDVRWVLQQAAWTAVRVDPDIKRLWQKISRSAGRKAAAVAVARKMLTWMWYAVCRNKPYQRPAAKAA
jgi:transposase